MAATIPVAIFDTSVINRLTDEPDCDKLLERIPESFAFCMTGTNAAEVAATTRPERRHELLDTCSRLLRPGYCLEPFFWIIEKHVQAHAANPAGYKWLRVDVRSPPLELAIAAREAFSDDIARREHADAVRSAKEFEGMFRADRQRFDAVFTDGSPRPSLQEVIEVLQKPGGVFWVGYGQMLYERYSRQTPDEHVVQDFVSRCPPFKMILLALITAQFYRAVTQTPRAKKRAGRIDLLSATYVPYGRVFVTNDADQERCLREMVGLAALEANVMSYAEFVNGLR